MTGIPDELIRAAGEAIEDEAMRLTGKDFGTIHRDTITRAALEAIGLPALLERVEAAEGEGCDCTELCSMGPTCPGGMLAGLDGSGCWRTGVTE